MAGATIGSAIVTGVGGILSSNAAKKGYKQLIEQLDQRINAINAHRDKVYYQDPTQTAENQAAVTQAKQVMDAGTQRAHDTSIVSGGTDEGEALQKQAAAATVGNMMQQQAVAGAEKKEQAWQDAEDRLDAFAKYKGEALKAQQLTKAQAITNAANASAQAQMELGKSMPW